MRAKQRAADDALLDSNAANPIGRQMYFAQWRLDLQIQTFNHGPLIGRLDLAEESQSAPH